MSSERTFEAGTSFSSGMLRILRTLAVLLPALPSAALAQPRSWLHVEVDQPEEERNVRVRLPLGVVESLADSLEERIFDGISEALENRDEDGDMDRFRTLWRSLGANPGAVVEVREGDSDGLTARMDGGEVRIEGGGDDGTVNVRIPVEVGDALFAADEPDAEALADALREIGENDGELASVESDEGRVRIWIGPAQ